VPVKGRIPAHERVEQGRALARLTDLGWGGTLRQLFAAGAADREADEALVRACAKVLGDWDWAERPAAIVSIPSRHRPVLIDSLARGLSALGRLPYLGSLDLVAGGPVGTPGGNSVYRLGSVWQRFEVSPALADELAALEGRPVLLVDDLVDSRWTMTIAGRSLRNAGVSSVLPFALALQM
jgi:ATP-dependent DNA helicase RecQ